jgi:hypothetical protein
MNSGAIILTSKEVIEEGSIDQDIETVLDAELVDTNIIVFDVMVLKNESCKDKTYDERVKLIGDVVVEYKDMFKKHTLRTKQILKITSDNIGRVFKQISVEDETDFPEDGHMLIRGDQSYFETTSYKIKPENTIDFLLIKYEKEYYLFCGISTHQLNNSLIKRLPGYGKFFHNISGQYVPIQFCPYDNRKAYIWKPTKKDIAAIESNLTMLSYVKQPCVIVELLPVFSEKDGVPTHNWELIKFREDRTNERNYYGNNYNIATLNWFIMQDPLVVKDMGMPVNTYFKYTKSPVYKAQVHFVSVCKTMIIEMLKLDSSNDFIVDFASGKGQDYNRIKAAGFSKGLFSDIDRTAIVTLLSRHLSDLKASHVRYINHKFMLAIQHADLSDPAELNIRKFQHHLEDGKPSIGINNLAIHYYVHDVDSRVNFLTFLNHVLDNKASFSYTCFNGRVIFDLLKSNGGVWIDQLDNGDDKYRIESRYSDVQFTGINQKIAVKLPMSDQLVEENLFDMEAFNEAATNFGFKVKKMGSMLDFVELMKKDVSKRQLVSAMNESDKHYAGLYHYCILER